MYLFCTNIILIYITGVELHPFKFTISFFKEKHQFLCNITLKYFFISITEIWLIHFVCLEHHNYYRFKK